MNIVHDVVEKMQGQKSPLAVHTDACKDLENAVENVFPHAELRECFGHMCINMIKKI
jgi:transposase-like protein